MGARNKIILPSVIAFVGIVTALVGRSGQVSADAVSASSSSTLYVLLTAAGFLIISVGAIVALFMVAGSEEKK